MVEMTFRKRLYSVQTKQTLKTKLHDSTKGVKAQHVETGDDVSLRKMSDVKENEKKP